MSGKGGYIYDFVDTVPEDYTCSICHHPMRNPHQLISCGHRFCKECLQQLVGDGHNCPIDRSHIDKQTVFADTAFNREIVNLHIYCTNRAKGCNWQNSLISHQHHLETCGFEIIRCSLTGCNHEMERRYFRVHIENECSWRLVPCEYCKNDVVFSSLEQHKESCDCVPLDCPNECKEMLIRRMITHHISAKCPRTIIDCPYSEFGCHFQRPFKCHHHGCSKEFSRPYHLKRHELFHSGIKPFRCTHEGCNVACTTKYNLKKHINKTHNKPFKCSFEGCEKECSKHKNLRSHECSHKDKLTYTCDVEGCSLSYKTPSKLKKHVMMHENGYKCKVENCNASFPKWTELLKHESFCRVIKCGKCGRILKSKENLQKHLKTHLKDRQVFKCPEDGCGRDYTKVSNLNAHLKAVHSCNTKLYVCPIAGCSSTFTYKHSLQKHLQNHDKIVKRRKKREKNTKAKECKKRQQTRIVTCEVSKLTGFVTELNDFISDEEMPETEIATDTETRKNIENRGKFICTEHPDCKMEAASRKESIPPAVQDIVDAFSVS